MRKKPIPEKIILPEGSLEHKNNILEIRHSLGAVIEIDIRELSSWMIRQIRKKIVRGPNKEPI